MTRSGRTGPYRSQQPSYPAVHEFGYATFDTASGGDLGELETITYATAAPEPATWAMLIAGAGVLGIATHRRRRAALAAA